MRWIKEIFHDTLVSAWIVEEIYGLLSQDAGDLNIPVSLFSWSVSENGFVDASIVLAADDACSTIVLFHTNIAIKVVIVDKNTCSASLPGILATRATLPVDHPHFHLNVEGIACPVSHIFRESVALHDDKWVVSVAEVRTFDMNDTSSCADVAIEGVVGEYDRAFVPLNHECGYVLEGINDEGIVKESVRRDDLTEEVPGSPKRVLTLFELQISLICIWKLNDHLLVIKVIVSVGSERLIHHDLLNIRYIGLKDRVKDFNCSTEADRVQN